MREGEWKRKIVSKIESARSAWKRIRTHKKSRKTLSTFTVCITHSKAHKLNKCASKQHATSAIKPRVHNAQQVNKQSIYHIGLAIRCHFPFASRHRCDSRPLLQIYIELLLLLLDSFEFRPHKLRRHMQTAAAVDTAAHTHIAKIWPQKSALSIFRHSLHPATRKFYANYDTRLVRRSCRPRVPPSPAHRTPPATRHLQ